MLPKTHSTIGNKANTSVMYIGAERFKALSSIAIDISYKGKRQITASQMAQYVLDNFMEAARDKLLKEIDSQPNPE